VRAEDYAAAGLYDPDAPNAPDRLELLRWLSERGVTVEQMIERGRALSGLAGDLALRPGRRISAREISSRLELPVEDVLSLALAAGLAPGQPDDLAFTEADLLLFEVFRGGSAPSRGASVRPPSCAPPARADARPRHSRARS